MINRRFAASACLCGVKCRYDGLDNQHFVLSSLPVIPICICPEVLGGLSIPRYRSEIKGLNVINEMNEEVTSFFENGAKKALEYLLKNDIDHVVLKEKSPSCGVRRIYNGDFNKTLIDGQGVFTRLAIANGIKVISDEEINSIDDLVQFLESK